MMKFKESKESIVNNILLWQQKPTQVSIKGNYEIKVHPTTGIHNDQSTIHFNIPPQPRGMLSDIDIVTTFSVKNGVKVLTNTDHCSIINNFANSFWEMVDVKIADRVDIMQIMRNSYSFYTFFEYILNSNPNREDYLYSTQLFKMDTGVTKEGSEILKFHGEGIVNSGAAERAASISGSSKVTITSKLHCPLITNSKSLPTNIKIRIGLTRNSDRFLLLTDNPAMTIHLNSVHLKVAFIRPHDTVLSLIEERLSKEAAPYFVTKPQLIVRPIAQSGRVVRINQIFNEKLPRHAFFCVQKSADFDGSFTSNPFAFLPFGKFQLMVDGIPHFADPIEMNYKTVNSSKQYTNLSVLLQQLYKTIGIEQHGSCLVNSSNIQQNFIVGVSLTSDKSSTSALYLNPKTEASTQLEIDFGFNVNITDDLILIVYAVYDRLIKIDSERNISIIE